MLITSLQTRRWIVPKGHLEPGMTAQDSAAKEAYEEAGLEGIVGDTPIGVYDYIKLDQGDQRIRRVDVFPMAVSRVLDKWPEQEKRQRKWMGLPDAVGAVFEVDLKKIIADFSPS